MAVFKTSRRMVYWKLLLDGSDITDLIAESVASIKIKNSILPPPPSRNKKNATPGNTAEITFVEKNDMVDCFDQGSQITIYMGYDPITLPKVFDGTIPLLPTGSAREMLEYTLKVYDKLSDGMMSEKIRVFPIPQKAAVIAQIAAENGWTSDIQIADTTIIPAVEIPINIGHTDVEILMGLAYMWNCVMWFQDPNILHFIDADRAHGVNDSIPRAELSLSESGHVFFGGKPGPYILGYRTDRYPCNVESVSWKHMNQRGLGGASPSSTRLTESGMVYDTKAHRISAMGKTWKLKSMVTDNKSVRKAWLYSRQAGVGTAKLRGYQVIQHFYVVEPEAKVKPDDPAHADAGFDITITLNEGDPYLKPPRNAKLYAGSINPRADSSYLPQWIYRTSIGYVEPANLKINKTELIYDHGRLSTKLQCSMGLFPEGL